MNCKCRGTAYAEWNYYQLNEHSSHWKRKVMFALSMSKVRSAETLETVVAEIHVERGCCLWIRTQRLAGTKITPMDKCFQALLISCTGKLPPGTGGVRQLGNDNRVVLICNEASSMPHPRKTLRACRARTIDHKRSMARTHELITLCTPRILIVVTRLIFCNCGGGWIFCFLLYRPSTKISSNNNPAALMARCYQWVQIILAPL